MYDAWQSQLRKAATQLQNIQASHTFFQPSRAEVPLMMHALSTNLSSHDFSRAVNHAAGTAILNTLAIGRQSVDAMFRKQTGRDPVRKDLVGGQASFGILFGMTEDHALQALVDQLTLSAGGFWDDQMTESVRKEMESWFDGDITRDELAANLKAMVNDRLSIEGKSSLPGSYFDGLAEHYVVRTRNVGSVYRAKGLGAEKYQIVNPRDHRTSEICEALSAPGLFFTMAAADQRVSDILGARSLQDLKTVAPFLTAGTASSESSPVPPLHWRCRSWMKYVFAGL